MNKIEQVRNELLTKIINELEISDGKKIRVEFPVGLGGNYILLDVIRKRIAYEKGILVLFDSRMPCEQFRKILDNTGITDNVYVSTYFSINQHNLSQNNEISLILCRGVHNLNDKLITQMKHLSNVRIVLIEDSGQRLQSENDEWIRWLDSFKLVFSYSMKQAIQDGYTYPLTGYQLAQSFFVDLLHYMDYQNIQMEVTNQKMNFDIVAEKNKKCIFELKYYKSLQNSQMVIYKAIERVLKYKEEIVQIYPDCGIYLIMFCNVDKKIKESAYNTGIIIWDIANLMFLCQGNKRLTEVLSTILDYSITDLVMEEPLADIKENSNEKIIESDLELFTTEEKKYDVYKKQLEECAVGKDDSADRQYELICAQILKELFEEQFSKMSEQACTSDAMFRMDLLCSLKGGTTFWNFLIDFYKTKFVVFEFKNYSGLISQNLIYICEKYLYSPALRNVAFIISRKGFDNNAKKAAKGCLIEHGKLILELNDEDLLCMLNLKDNGQEPSDYLMEKVEDLLMRISK